MALPRRKNLLDFLNLPSWQAPAYEMAIKKILTYSEMDSWMEEQRATGVRVGFTCGTFDLLHAGHADYLEKARQLCDKLMVGVNSDASVQRYKSKFHPLMPQMQRALVVSALASVDVVTIMEEDRPAACLRRWKPNLYIKGGDYAVSSLRSSSIVSEYGGDTVVIPFVHAVSTSTLIERAAALWCHAKPTPAPSNGPVKIALLDRDGTVIEDIPYLHDPAKVRLLPGAGEGLRMLQDEGWRLAIATNQQGIGLGYYSMQDMIAVNQRMFSLLSEFGVCISKIYFCPHTACDGCDCRKPRIGMIERALKELGGERENCVFIGNAPADIEAALKAGCLAIRVGKAVERASGHAVVNDLLHAAQLVTQEWKVKADV